ncbi:MAG: DNA polymerase III subunit delta, partial [Myxococcota bacterium]
MAKKKGSDAARDFFRELKRTETPKPIYIVFGEETFMLDLAMKELTELVLPGGINDFNYDVFYAREVDAHKVISACETLALFGGSRLVILKDIQWMSAADLKPLTSYLDDPSPTTTLVCHGVTTTRALTKTTGFYRKARKVGGVQEFKALREWEVGRFLRVQAGKRKLELSREAEDALIGSVGTDLATLDMALEKLDLYLGPNGGGGVRRVTEEMLQGVVATTRSHEIFELTEAIASQNLGQSMVLL